jgi:hypothetical protein
VKRRAAPGWAALVLAAGTVLVSAPLLLDDTAAEAATPTGIASGPAASVDIGAEAETQNIVGDTVVGGSVVALGLLTIAGLAARRTD